MLKSNKSNVKKNNSKNLVKTCILDVNFVISQIITHLFIEKIFF